MFYVWKGIASATETAMHAMRNDVLWHGMYASVMVSWFQAQTILRGALRNSENLSCKTSFGVGAALLFFSNVLCRNAKTWSS